ncbi:MAG: hypothetical protein IJT23_10180 [Clostridia bacterium]|nr:hypothetical protein [Clostridia bacterium]
MKEMYENPIMDIIDFNGENILTASGSAFENDPVASNVAGTGTYTGGTIGGKTAGTATIGGMSVLIVE